MKCPNPPYDMKERQRGIIICAILFAVHRLLKTLMSLKKVTIFQIKYFKVIDKMEFILKAFENIIILRWPNSEIGIPTGYS